MPHCSHQFALEFTGPKGQALGQHRVTPAWEAGVEWLRYYERFWQERFDALDALLQAETMKAAGPGKPRRNR